MKLFYSPDYVLAEYAFDTTRKARWVAESLQAAPVAGVEFVAPGPVTEAQVCEVHDPAYVAAIRTGEPRAGGVAAIPVGRAPVAERLRLDGRRGRCRAGGAA